jgi:hypothetical protein
MGNGSIAPPFINSALHRDQWSASSSGRFIPGENAPQYPMEPLSQSRPYREEGKFLALVENGIPVI